MTCLLSMFIFLFEFLFILHSIYFQIGKSFFLQNTRKKCEVLDIIPYNLDINQCEIITYVCCWMLSDVPIRNVITGGDEQILCIIEGVQIVDTNFSDEESSGRSKGENNS